MILASGRKRKRVLFAITHVSRVKIRKGTPSPLGSKTRFKLKLGLSSLYRLLAKFHRIYYDPPEEGFYAI